ncbi:Farnesyl pyrophosphate synthetase [Pleurotus pulmonarius]|nr:Farnesyl pyrophosphate synthetase [Pleurotus pulmonarius]
MTTDLKANAKAQRRQRFEGAWKVIRDELVEHLASEGMPSDAIEWFGKNLDYNVPGGKLNRGMSVVDSVEILKNRELTEEEYFQAAVLGWCIELLQAYFLVSDDMMDGSITRRDQPCWYRVQSVGNIAINDSFMLEAAIYWLLKKHFRQSPCYVDLLEVFHETTYQTEMGQLIDLITAPEDHVDLSKFSLKKHRLIVVYKTAFYSFYLPVACAMYLCGVPPSYIPSTEPFSSTKPVHPYDVAKAILVPLGEYFQVQDDFLDYSAPPEVLGKIGTDIIDNKCSWVINTALALVTPEQRKVLDQNYGKKGKEEEQRVKDVFKAVGIEQKYAEYEQNAYETLTKLISEVPEGTKETELKQEVFTSFLNKIYKRTK